ncbi:MAG: glycine dehydrogenase subunit 2 [Deltaproteobacteria bacterium]|nr:MAG: glycine dehydrogenase subunit 2 [Deltaproteobacteria bacterium]
MTVRRPHPDTPPGTSGLLLEEPLLFERGAHGRSGASLPPPRVPEVDPATEIPSPYLRGPAQEDEGLPALSEPEVVRHFTRLSQWNYGIDSGPFPLGSCTMKYNPRVNEAVARLPGLAGAHPYLPEARIQGPLALMWHLARALAEIGGFAEVTLQPAAGAQGELTGVKMIRAWHEHHHGRPREIILVPASAHGTNPATSTLAGYRTVEIRGNEQGFVEPAAVAEAMDERVAGLMITNPNTLGIFERHIAEIAEIVHAKGGLLYCDGANMNALLGQARPGEMGIDVMHFNLHKTFTTPHGGGGPGAGPVGVCEKMVPHLPTPVVARDGDRYFLDYDRPLSIGRVKPFYGNFGVLVRAYAFIREMGADGLKRASELAVLNANYLRALLEQPENGGYVPGFPGEVLHEVVFSDRSFRETGVSTFDVAKRLIDLGFHPPTVYFPLVVHGALMIEPTETEPKENLDAFVAAMRTVAEEAQSAPERLKAAPTRTIRERLDETRAARSPVLRWTPDLDARIEAQTQRRTSVAGDDDG